MPASSSVSVLATDDRPPEQLGLVAIEKSSLVRGRRDVAVARSRVISALAGRVLRRRDADADGRRSSPPTKYCVDASDRDHAWSSGSWNPDPALRLENAAIRRTAGRRSQIVAPTSATSRPRSSAVVVTDHRDTQTVLGPRTPGSGTSPARPRRRGPDMYAGVVPTMAVVLTSPVLTGSTWSWLCRGGRRCTSLQLGDGRGVV